MKKWIWIPILIILLIVFACQKQEKAEESTQKDVVEEIAPIAQGIEHRLTACLEQFEQGEVYAGVSFLLEVVEMTRPGESFPEGFLDMLSAAREDFQAGDYQEGVIQVAQAHEMFEASLRISPSSEADKTVFVEKTKEDAQVAPVAAMIKDKIEYAREMFKQGDADSGVIMIFEAIELLAPKTLIQE
jgi:HEPN domain-containing protein